MFRLGAIYDIHKEGPGSGGRLRMGKGAQHHVDIHTEN